MSDVIFHAHDRWVDLSLTSEDNPFTPTLAERMGAHLDKRYRTYHLRIA